MGVFKLEEWQGGSGRWYCGDTSNLGGNSGHWYHEPRILGITGDEFVKMLHDDFHCDYITYNSDKNMLIYSWDSQANMRKYKNFLNKKAREKNYTV